MSQIDAKQAVAAATNFFKMLYEGVAYSDLLVEEIELDGTLWKVTLGYARPPHSPMALITHLEPKREYKAFTVNAATGQVESMRLRGASPVD